MLDPHLPGSCVGICDVCRAMLETNNIQQVCWVVLALMQSDEIEIVRIKDRFVSEPHPSGWRDLMINFYFIRFVCSTPPTPTASALDRFTPTLVKVLTHCTMFTHPHRIRLGPLCTNVGNTLHHVIQRPAAHATLLILPGHHP